MRKLLLLPVLALCAHADIFPIIESATATSGAGISGVGGYQNDVTITYSLEQYDLQDMVTPGLSQPVYFRYSYLFTTPAGFGPLILGLSDTCAGDSECMFDVQLEGVLGETKWWEGEPGLEDPLHGIGISSLPTGLTTWSLSFFSNRVPAAAGRLYMRNGDDYFLTEPGAVTTPDFRAFPVEEPTHTPEPISSTLFGGGLLAVTWLKLYGKRKRL